MRLNGLPFLAVIVFSACTSSSNVVVEDAAVEGAPLPRDPSEVELIATIRSQMPRIDREFRAAWVATVDNIDWPSEPGLSTAQQQSEMLGLLDRAVMMNMNAIIFQVRPMADALYASELEPWSYYLTGEAGKPPDPAYDPLTFAVEEAHRRGLELHAWFNPYRAYHPTAPDSLTANHVSALFPEAVHQYGNHLWMDPGSPDATDHTFSVIMDVLRRYDIDGVHLDDYFYPYSIDDARGNEVEFPDSVFFAASGDSLNRSDWRRKNVDDLIENLYIGIKELKPWVLFGISPFGIWRPGYPDGITGFDAYENLYADSRKWLLNGWVDYFSPQLYWAIDSTGQPYTQLLGWWIEQNQWNRHIWPGNYTSRVILEGSSHWGPEEIVSQVRQTRLAGGATGNVHFSMRSMMPASHEMGNALTSGVYSKPAIAPRTTWLDGEVPGTPTIEVLHLGERSYLALFPPSDRSLRNWVIHIKSTSGWETKIVPGWNRTFSLDAYPAVIAVVVRAVSRLGLESEAAISLIR